MWSWQMEYVYTIYIFLNIFENEKHLICQLYICKHLVNSQMSISILMSHIKVKLSICIVK
jgi:hypothetical protein